MSTLAESHAQQEQLQLFASCLWSNISRASDKLRAHSIQALLKKAENANGFPSHPQVFSAVAVISTEKSCPCLGTQAGSFPHCFVLYYFFFFFLKCHLPSCSSAMVLLRLTNTKAPALCHYCSTAWINSCSS